MYTVVRRQPSKLGIFGINVSYGCSATTAEGHWETSWPANVEMVTLADQAGIEAFIPIARWRGFGGNTNFNGSCFETYTWAAGLGALTKQIAVFSTSHVPTIHPSWRPNRPPPSTTFPTAALD